MIPPITEEDHEMSDNPFMTSEELRNLFRCSSTTLWRMRQTPKFPMPRQFGRRLLWVRKDIEAFLALDA
ncbi:hypothetical protein C5L43_04670 [Ectopseudomonas oleovorans]|nr:hypothetical protein C5L43_04670 [Pseudomonas oleovorans]